MTHHNNECLRLIRRGLYDFFFGMAFLMANIAKAAFHAVNSAAHRLPWLFMLIEAAILTAFFLAALAQARSERDASSHTAYTYRLRAEQLSIINQSYRQ